MPTFHHEIVINKPIEKVFAVVADVHTHSQWQAGIVRSEVTSPGNTGVGTTGIEVRRMFGRENQFPYRITTYNPPNAWGFEVTTGPIRPAATLQFSNQNGGTLIRSELRVPGFMGWLMGNMMLNQQKQNYVRLKELVESGQL